MATLQPLEKKIWDMLNAGVEDLGLRLVRVLISGDEGSSTLQLMIEPKDASPNNRISVNVDECALVSRMASAILDVEDPISGHYNLEVSSTGLERPLVTKQDFELYAGFNCKIKTVDAVEGRKRFKGQVVGLSGDELSFKSDEGEDFTIHFENVSSAKLVVSDAELAEIMNKLEESE